MRIRSKMSVRSVACALLLSALTAWSCTSRVSLGVLDPDDAGAAPSLDASFDAPPVRFGGDAATRDARAPGAPPTFG